MIMNRSKVLGYLSAHCSPAGDFGLDIVLISFLLISADRPQKDTASAVDSGVRKPLPGEVRMHTTVT